MSQTLGDLQATIDAAANHGKVGVVGYCFGGLLTWLSSCNLNQVSAASAYYGGGIPDNADMTPSCPIILHFGEQDAHIPMDSVAPFRKSSRTCRCMFMPRIMASTVISATPMTRRQQARPENAR